MPQMEEHAAETFRGQHGMTGKSQMSGPCAHRAGFAEASGVYSPLGTGVHSRP